MNDALLEQIIKHIFYNLSIIKSPIINYDKTKSIMSPEFILENKLLFEIESENHILKNNIWGCKSIIDQKDMIIMLGDCSQNIDYKEFCVIVQLKDTPAYGLYLNIDDKNTINSNPLLSISMDNKTWTNCNVYLQATFLAAMENIKYIDSSWIKYEDYKNHYHMMLSFIEHYNDFYVW